MKGIYIALALLFAASFTARLDAQIAISEDMFGRTSFTVKAQVLDSLTREPIAFASAYLRHPKDTVITSFALTDTLGKAELKKVAKESICFALNISATDLSIRRFMSVATMTRRRS